MSTYFLVTTVDADDAADAVALARHMDEPTDPPTVTELRGRILSELNRLLLDVGLLAGTPVPEMATTADRIVEIVTLGNVPADS